MYLGESPKCFPEECFFLVFLKKYLSTKYFSTKRLLAWKTLVAPLHSGIIFFAKRSILQSILKDIFPQTAKLFSKEQIAVI